MASYRNSKSTGRRTVLMMVFLAVVGLAVWRTFFGESPLIEWRKPQTEVLRPVSLPPPLPPATPLKVETAKTPAVAPQPVVAETPAVKIAVEPMPPPAPPVETIRTEAQKFFDEGRKAMEGRDYLNARKRLTQAVEAGLPEAEDKQARELLSQAADQWLFSRIILANDPLCVRYSVAAGDMLVTLQKKFEVPFALLMKVNMIKNAGGLRVGEPLKAVQGPFRAVLEKSKFRLTLYLGDTVVRSYTVSIGAPGMETPTGLWVVKLKQPNPAWTDPVTSKKYLPDDPENPLGDHWVALDGVEGAAVGRTGFGIHGTSKPDEIGKATSRGCIRLHNGQAAEVYDLLLEGKSTLRVVD